MDENNNKTGSLVKKTAHFFARPDLFFYTLIWLMVLLFIGTVSQKTIGLYQAQEKFFSSWVLWLGDFVPVPGAMLCLSVVFLSLMAKLSLQKWTRSSLGTLVIHIGAMLLLFGGFLTAQFSTEGYMAIPEEQSSSYVEDYFALELAVTDLETKQAVTFPGDLLSKNETLIDKALPFRIEVDEFYQNIVPVRRDTPREDNAHGMVLNIDLQPVPRAIEEESNNAGLVFRLIGTGEADGLYSLFETMPIQQSITTDDGGEYTIELRPVRRSLPFEIRLVDFEKQSYPGTDNAKSYQSEVILKDNGVEWRSVISMNEPLRYKGYTFFQSSFLRDGEREITVLAVVENIGRLFPYISSIVMCVGLLLHLFVRLPTLIRRREDHA